MEVEDAAHVAGREGRRDVVGNVRDDPFEGLVHVEDGRGRFRGQTARFPDHEPGRDRARDADDEEPGDQSHAPTLPVARDSARRYPCEHQRELRYDVVGRSAQERALQEVGTDRDRGRHQVG